MNGAYYTLHDVFHKKVQIYMQYGILVEIAVSKAICNIIFAAGLPFIPQPLWYIEPCLGSMGFTILSTLALAALRKLNCRVQWLNACMLFSD
jgi:hypothetical protein